MKVIIINSEDLQTRVAVVEDGKLQDYFIERKDDDHIVGSIFKGKIKNLEPSLQAAFVDIGAKKNAFLHYWDMLPATQEMLEGGEKNSYREEDKKRTESKNNDNKRNNNNRNNNTRNSNSHNNNNKPASQKISQKEQKPTSFLAKMKAKLFGKKVESAKTESQAKSQPKQYNRRPKRRRKPIHKPKPAFTVEDIPNLFKENSDVIVQVTKGPISTKGARVTTNLSIPGRQLVLLPNSNHVGISKRISDREERSRLRPILRRLNVPKNMGLICRTIGSGKTEEEFQSDMQMLMDSWKNAEELNKNKPAPYCIYQEPSLVERSVRDYLTQDVDEIITDSQETYELVQKLAQSLNKNEQVKIRLHKQISSVFTKYRLDTQIKNIFSRRVPLPSGSYLVIDETEALIAIDVNTGKSKGGKDHPETIINTNLEAVEEIARQLRLRNIGGLIVLDLIDMRSRKDQQTVYRAFKEALKKDRAKTRAYPISALGLIEMTRQREHESLRDTVFNTCPYCDGQGVVRSAISMSVLIQRKLQETMRRQRKHTQVKVIVHPQILERLKNEDAKILREMEKEYGGELTFRADENLHMEDFKLIDQTSGQEL